jgi:hypothetical protein
MLDLKPVEDADLAWQNPLYCGIGVVVRVYISPLSAEGLEREYVSR